MKILRVFYQFELNPGECSVVNAGAVSRPAGFDIFIELHGKPFSVSKLFTKHDDC